MEDFKTLKEIVNFAITVILLLLICLVIYKFGKSIDGKIELNIKESKILDLKIENEKKNAKILDKTLEVNGIEK
jgi:cell division protein FtsL